jgi:hypothetical protein
LTLLWYKLASLQNLTHFWKKKETCLQSFTDQICSWKLESFQTFLWKRNLSLKLNFVWNFSFFCHKKPFDWRNFCWQQKKVFFFFHSKQNNCSTLNDFFFSAQNGFSSFSIKIHDFFLKSWYFFYQKKQFPMKTFLGF